MTNPFFSGNTRRKFFSGLLALSFPLVCLQKRRPNPNLPLNPKEGRREKKHNISFKTSWERVNQVFPKPGRVVQWFGREVPDGVAEPLGNILID